MVELVLKTNKEIAIVLGGTNPHIELIKKLKNRGYYVILVDYLENPPAKEVADLHIKESTLDPEAVFKIAKEYNAKLVISACVDQANITACYVAEKLNLTKPYSYELANNITNKGFMKKVMMMHNIPTTKYLYLENNEEIETHNLKYPIMVKPADSCAASGVKKANNEIELNMFLKEAKAVSRTGRTVIEEYFEGIEVSAYCFVSNKQAKVIMISERISTIEGEEQVLKCYATVTPPNISKVAMVKIEKAADDIAMAFDLDNTPLHVQAIINGDEISIIEFAPRVGGGISYFVIRENTGFDIIEATIDSYEEKMVKLDYKIKEQFYSINLIYGRPGIFDHVEGVEKLIEEDVIQGLFYHKTKGMKITEDRASGGRIGAFLVKGKTKEDMCQKIKYAIDNMEVLDCNGENILRKDLYLK